MNEAELFAEFVQHREAFKALAPFWESGMYDVVIKKRSHDWMERGKSMMLSTEKFYVLIKRVTATATVDVDGKGDTLVEAARNAAQRMHERLGMLVEEDAKT